MIRRRTFLQAAAAATTLGLPARAQQQAAAMPDDLLDRARALAGQPWGGGSPPLPPPFADLNYNQYRAIRPRPGLASELPLGQDYAVDLLPPGYFLDDLVTIDIVRGGEIVRVPFSEELFTFGERYFDEIPEVPEGEGGFSGLRLRHPLNDPAVMDEFLVMQGASYFRAIGRDTAYGLSARTLALGTGSPGPEEFPAFTWLRVFPPGEGSTGPRISALVDSPSCTAHLMMEAQPGEDTVTRCQVTVFPRTDLTEPGIAPLTSMFFKGPIRAAVADDFRPAVHDSDALWIENGAGEVLWRPLTNPASIQTSSFADDGPRGFGLVQTPRDFEAFQDAEAAYHRRPSARIVPRGDWGPGAVTLVELPTGDEFADNMVAFWRPAEPLRAGGEYRFAYDIVWTRSLPPMPDLAPILQSRSGRQHDRDAALRYVVDFEGLAEGEPVPDLTVAGETAQADGLASYVLPGTDTRRVSFVFEPREDTTVELRLVMRDEAGAPLTPVWLHRWTPARDSGP